MNGTEAGSDWEERLRGQEAGHRQRQEGVQPSKGAVSEYCGTIRTWNGNMIDTSIRGEPEPLQRGSRSRGEGIGRRMRSRKRYVFRPTPPGYDQVALKNCPNDTPMPRQPIW